jgi:hypothetical protein
VPGAAQKPRFLAALGMTSLWNANSATLGMPSLQGGSRAPVFCLLGWAQPLFQPAQRDIRQECERGRGYGTGQD